MFETAELGRRIPKREYSDRVDVLRQELLTLQNELREVGRSRLIVVFAGVDGAGKRETVGLLNNWMDARWMVTRAFETTEEERRFPEYWRYWRTLPPRGRIGLFLSAWYSQPVVDRAYDRITPAEFDAKLDEILAFETALADDGAAVVKFWMHLSREAQETRLMNLKNDPLTRARVREEHWRNLERYDRFVGAAERVISRTNAGHTPWTIVEGVDPNYRSLTVGEIVRDTLRRTIDDVRHHEESERRRAKKSEKKGGKKSKGKKEDDPPQLPTVLSKLDNSKSIPKDEYTRELKQLQAELHLLHLRARDEGVATVLVFEGWDAAGKGGAIRRVAAALEPKNCQVHGVAVPTDEELAQHYLWRFWRNVPRDGRVAIFDRSWYGRVLVERVEGFASEPEWRRAYAEINDFENQIVGHGSVLVKFWIHITEDEQLKRFQDREKTPYKHWKLTEDDWRNREKWPDYEEAFDDVVQYTSTRVAPWTLVEGNDKRHARIKVLRTVCERLRERLGEPEGESDMPGD